MSVETGPHPGGDEMRRHGEDDFATDEIPQLDEHGRPVRANGDTVENPNLVNTIPIPRVSGDTGPQPRVGGYEVWNGPARSGNTLPMPAVGADGRPVTANAMPASANGGSSNARQGHRFWRGRSRGPAAPSPVATAAPATLNVPPAPILPPENHTDPTHPAGPRTIGPDHVEHTPGPNGVRPVHLEMPKKEAPVGSDGSLEIHIVNEDKLLESRKREIQERRLSEALAAHKGAGSVLRSVWHREYREGGRILKQAIRHPVEGLKQHRDEIWKGNIARDYYLLKEGRQAGDEIVESHNAYVHDGIDSHVYEREVSADVDRFVHSYHESIDADEHRGTRLTSPEGQPIVQAIHGLIRRAVTEKWDEATFREARIRSIDEVARNNPSLMKEASLYGDNLGQILEQVRDRIAAGNNLDVILANTHIYLDRSNMGTRSEAKYTAAEKVIDKLKQSKLTSFVNETTIVAGVSIAFGVAKYSGRRASRIATKSVGVVLGGPIGYYVALGASAAVIAGFRENARAKAERAHDSAEREVGARGRVEFDASAYELVNVNFATELLRNVVSERQPDGTRIPKAASADVLGLGMQYLADLDVRRTIATRDKVAMFQYASTETRSTEKKAMYYAMADARSTLRQMAAGNPDLLGGIGMAGVGNAPNFDAAMESLRGTLMNNQERNMKQRDRIFKGWKRKKVWKAAGKAFLTGITFGIVGQEVAAFVEPNEVGELKSLTEHYSPNNADVHQTVLHAAIDQVFGHDKLVGTGPHHLVEVNGHAANIPGGTDFVQQPDGSYAIMNGDHIAAGGIHFEPDGQMTAASIAHLRQEGVIADVQKHVVGGTETHTLGVTPEQYAHLPGNHLVSVNRTLWYDDGSPAPGPTLGNGLRLTYGGVNGTGIDAHGNYVMSVAGMTPGGSFHDGLSANAQHLLREGKMELMLSMNEKTQSHVFGIHFNSHGEAIINRNSEAGQLFRTQQLGGVKSAMLVGKYAEADQIMSVKNGVTNVRMLATAVGEGVKSIHAPVSTVVEHTTYSTTFDILKPPPVDAPPVIPIYGRKGLDPIEQAQAEIIPIVARQGERTGYYMGMDWAERQRQWELDRSPRLRDNPDAELNMAEEVAWYVAEQRNRRGDEYVDALRARVEATPGLKDINPNIQSFACVPVAAAVEGDYIYGDLSLYAQLDPDTLKDTVVLLNVNWPSDADMTKVARTKAEIERAQRDFPQLTIVTFDQMSPREWIAERNDQVYGHILKELYDTAMMAVHEKAEAGELMSKDVLIVTNDADGQGMSRNYFRQFHRSMEAHPESDIFLGTIRWGTQSYVDYPGYEVVNNAAQLMQQLSRRPNSPYGNTAQSTGPNSAFRMSALAAVGGPNEWIGLGADNDLGARVWAARGGVGGSSPAASSTAGTASGGKSGAGRKRRVASMVTGAGIDTSPERLLRAYTEGRLITHAWDNFDANGYEPRTAQPLRGAERDEPDDMIIGHVEVQLSAIINDWYTNTAQYTNAFNLMFPPGTETTKDDVHMWEVTRGSDGASVFHFTPKGRDLVALRFHGDSANGIRSYSELVMAHMDRTHVRPLKRPVPPVPTRSTGGSSSSSARPAKSSTAGRGSGATSSGSRHAATSSGGLATGAVRDSIDTPLSQRGGRSARVVEPAPSASRGGDSPERFGNTDDDVILREDERGQRREAQRVAEAEARAAERRAAYTKINNQLRAARNTKQLLHIAKAAVKQGYLVESTSPKGTQGPLAGRFAAAKGFQSAGIYERLAEADESVSSYHQLRNWLMGLKSSELGTDIIQRRQLEQLIGNISRDSFSGHEIPLTGARVRAMLGTNTPPSHAILEAIQKQLIAGHHAGDKYVPPSQKARGDVTYKHGRAVQLVPLDKAGLDALEAIDKRLGRKRKKREIVEWAVDPAENKRFLASQPKPAYS